MQLLHAAVRGSLLAVPDDKQQPAGGAAPRNSSNAQNKNTTKTSAARRWLKDVVSPAVLIVGVIAIVVGIITVRDADKQAQSGRELTWRTVLKADAVLPGAYLPHLDLIGLYIPGADLSGGNLSSDNLASSTMTDARFDGADLSNSNLKDARLDNATLSGANLDGANMQRASLTGADLRGASFKSTDLSRADMFEADVRGTDLSTTKLSDVYLSFLCWDSSTKWPRTVRPSEPYCPPPTARKAPQAEQWKIDSFVAFGAPLKSWAPVSAVTDTDSQSSTLIVRFHNEGRVVLNSVAIAVHLTSPSIDATWIPTKVVMINGNYPKGYEFPTSAIIDSGRTVSVNIGNYAGGGVAYLEITLVPRHTERQVCGTVPLGSDTYATPSAQGSVEAKTTTDFQVTRRCR